MEGGGVAISEKLEPHCTRKEVTSSYNTIHGVTMAKDVAQIAHAPVRQHPLLPHMVLTVKMQQYVIKF